MEKICALKEAFKTTRFTFDIRDRDGTKPQ